jgi:hypothetical protein
MGRRLAIWLAVLLFVGGGTFGLISLAMSGATEFRVEDERRLVIEGPITGASTERVQRILEQNPGLEEVVLGDIPGTSDLNWLLAIGYLFRQNELATRAVGVLHNDGILLLLAGDPRVIDGGRLVLTGDALARRDGLPVDPRPVTLAERQGYVARMLGDAGFADYMVETRARTDRAEIGAEDIARFGLVSAAP